MHFTHLLNEISNLLIGPDLQAVAWASLESRSHVSTEDIGTVIKTSVELAQVIVLKKDKM